MIHNGECNIDLAAGLDMKPTKVVFQSAGAAPAPAKIVIQGKHAVEAFNLLSLIKGPDAELAERLREKMPSDKTDEECAKEVRAMAFERLMELREEK